MAGRQAGTVWRDRNENTGVAHDAVGAERQSPWHTLNPRQLVSAIRSGLAPENECALTAQAPLASPREGAAALSHIFCAPTQKMHIYNSYPSPLCAPACRQKEPETPGEPIAFT